MISAALLLLSLSAHPPDAGHPAEPGFLSVPDVIEHVAVPGETKALGVPVHLEAVRSKRSIDELIQYFADEFQRHGLYIPPPKHQPQITAYPQLNALDVDKLVSYSVILQPNPDGTTNVILGSADLYRRDRAAQKPFAPVAPTGSDPFVSHEEGVDTMVYTATASSDAVMTFYDQTLPQGGYKKVSPGLYRNGAQELQVDTQAHPDGRQTVLVFHRARATEGAQDYPAPKP